MSFPDPSKSTPDSEIIVEEPSRSQAPDSKTIAKHLGLFIATFICVTFTGILWVGQSAGIESFMEMVPEGALFATIFLLFLAAHEFGHYFAAVYHNVRVTLPYFIPIPVGIGTLGAVIRIKEKINDTRKLFDIGIAGPIAGFVVSLATLLYGFFTLPGPEFIMNFAGHEGVIAHVQEFGTFPDSPPEESEGMLMVMGNTLLYTLISGFFENAPPMWEMYHYPFLFAGWLGLFFTALNLMPIGQLDGGHIMYSLLGYRRHKMIARGCFGFITMLAGLEAIPFIHVAFTEMGWAYHPSLSILVWALILFLLIRRAFHGEHRWVAPVWAGSVIIAAGYLFMFNVDLQQTGSLIWVVWSFFLTYFVGMEHPPALYEKPLTQTRRNLGWISMLIFILCISPNPIYFLN